MSNTVSESYIEGFCKVAEAAGVDPEALVKRASLAGTFRRARAVLNPKKLKQGTKRFFELMTGSRARDYDTRTRMQNFIPSREAEGPLGPEELHRAFQRGLKLRRVFWAERQKVRKARAIAGGVGLAGALSGYGLSGDGSNSNHTADGQ